MDNTRIAELIDRAATCLAEARAELAGPIQLAADLAAFIAAECYLIDGAKTKFTDFYEELAAFSGRRYSKTLLAKSFPEATPYGFCHSNQRYIGNLCLRSMGTPPAPGPKLVLAKEKLKRAA